jgi:hypothetical protein
MIWLAKFDFLLILKCQYRLACPLRALRRCHVLRFLVNPESDIMYLSHFLRFIHHIPPLRSFIEAGV